FFEGVPLVMDFAKNEVDRQALRLAFARQGIAYAFAAPPDVPADRIKALRAGFEGAVKDPEFLAEAAQMNADIGPVDGDGVLEIIRQASAMPKAVIERGKSALTVAKD